VYELLEKQIDSFKMLPAANKKPLSRAEQELKGTAWSVFVDADLTLFACSFMT
jgi:hypothetical protein